jgi:hypothetical protein
MNIEAIVESAIQRDANQCVPERLNKAAQPRLPFQRARERADIMDDLLGAGHTPGDAERLADALPIKMPGLASSPSRRRRELDRPNILDVEIAAGKASAKQAVEHEASFAVATSCEQNEMDMDSIATKNGGIFP